VLWGFWYDYASAGLIEGFTPYGRGEMWLCLEMYGSSGINRRTTVFCQLLVSNPVSAFLRLSEFVQVESLEKGKPRSKDFG
jgi:hypothetical protein